MGEVAYDEILLTDYNGNVLGHFVREGVIKDEKPYFNFYPTGKLTYEAIMKLTAYIHYSNHNLESNITLKQLRYSGTFELVFQHKGVSVHSQIIADSGE